jgi:hypothetical protein
MKTFICVVKKNTGRKWKKITEIEIKERRWEEERGQEKTRRNRR